MKIVFISDYTPLELYLIGRVSRQFPDTVTIVPKRMVGSEKPVQIRRSRPLYHAFNGLMWSVRRRAWRRRIFPDGEESLPGHVVPIGWDGLTNSEGLKVLEEFTPDVLITCRAPILPPELIATASLASLNLHFGIVPEYRGNDTIFWPLYRNEPQLAGGTIHYLSEGVDTGNVLIRAYPGLQPGDSEVEIECKTTRLLTAELIRLLERIGSGSSLPKGEPQVRAGRNYLKRERTMSRTAELQLLRIAGLRPVPHRTEYVERCYENGAG